MYQPDNNDSDSFNNLTVVKRQCIISPCRDEGVHLELCEVANAHFLFQSDIFGIYTRGITFRAYCAKLPVTNIMDINAKYIFF